MLPACPDIVLLPVVDCKRLAVLVVHMVDSVVAACCLDYQDTGQPAVVAAYAAFRVG